MAQEDARQLCASAGQELSVAAGGGWRCSGTDPGFGLDAVVFLRFCDNSLCQVDVAFPPASGGFSGWITRYDELREVLSDRYGPLSSEVRLMPSQCQSHYLDCFALGAARFSATWRWFSGYTVVLGSVYTDEFIHVSYFSPEAAEFATEATTHDGASEPLKYPGL